MRIFLSVILALIYVSVLVLHIYRAHRKRLIRRLTEYVEHGTMGDLLLGGRELVATLWLSFLSYQTHRCPPRSYRIVEEKYPTYVGKPSSP